MKSFDLWLVGFGLRCGALLVGVIASFAFVIPTLFNLHSDLADAGAALLAIVAVAGTYLSAASLGREFNLIFRRGDHE